MLAMFPIRNRRTTNVPVSGNWPRGISMIEVLVSLGIIALLCALTLPAVQYCRERVRCMACANSLRQIGVAFQNYESSHGCLPIGWQTFVGILPQIDNSPLFESIQAGSTPVTLNVSLFVCPSDPLAFASKGHISYLLNEGTGYQRYGANGMLLERGPKVRWTRSADIVDGLSNTACAADNLIRPYRSLREEFDVEPRRALWYTPVVRSGRDELDEFRKLCRSSRVSPLPSIASYEGLTTGWGYNHILGPNSVGCHNGPAVTVFLLGPNYEAVPPSSLHRGGVNILFADGSVRFTADSVSESTWTAVGSRSGGDME